MPISPEQQTLLARAQRVFRGKPIAETVPRDRAIIGVKALPAGEKDAQAALEKLGNGEEPTPVEMAALEFMIRLMRPAIPSFGGKLGAMPAAHGYNQPLIDQWNAFREAVAPLLYSIGRIDREPKAHVGTGFLIAEDILVTNRHVLHQLTFGVDTIGKGQAVVKFGQESDRPDDEGPVAIVGVVALEATLDIALLKIEPQTKPRLVFDAAPVVSSMGVAAVGYPGEDPRSPAFVPAVYENRLGTKHASPGEVLDVNDDLVFHDCSTLGGNSGSPVFSLATGKVVGIHRSGTFMYRNKAIPATKVQAFVAPHVA